MFHISACLIENYYHYIIYNFYKFKEISMIITHIIITYLD